MYSAHQVRSKTRRAIKRREEEVEQEEIEGGELNLIPYLDIVTNLMLFLLASVSASLMLGQLNTMLPDSAPPGAGAQDKPPETKPEDVPLKLVVSVTKDKLILWSVSQREGTLNAPALTLGRIGLDGTACDGGYMCETGYCDYDSGVCGPDPNPKEGDAVERLPVFDYRQLNAKLYEIARKYYPGKVRAPDTYQIVLMADDSTPYETLVSVMGSMRCKMPPVGEKTPRCMLPLAKEDFDSAVQAAYPLRESQGKVSEAISRGFDENLRVFDASRINYDPDQHALFHDVLFSRGFE